VYRRRGDARGADERIGARIETILAAGSIGSPQIMQLSGVGPGVLLQEHGIPVLHEMPGVGENLQDHLQLRMAFKVQNVVTLNQRVHSLFGKAAMGLEYALFRSGPLTMAPSQLGGFTRSSPQYRTPNVEIHTQPLSLDSSATRCIRLTRSPRASAICGRLHAGTFASRVRTRALRPRSIRAI